ncbi:hypothetical protein CTEN210_05033 [Chaetoceros tenuissimus]|uniref:EF-hand domain-containing protein n=1 Tax=Chaetoceros tenuissimus TaxID=426638 RepID=A0AAD3H2U9_9STRA|nr:hypothetical protein CTEN210_05033 [Chaetoceros tenuissimus]
MFRRGRSRSRTIEQTTEKQTIRSLSKSRLPSNDVKSMGQFVKEKRSISRTRKSDSRNTESARARGRDSNRLPPSATRDSSVSTSREGTEDFLGGNLDIVRTSSTWTEVYGGNDPRNKRSSIITALNYRSSIMVYNKTEESDRVTRNNFKELHAMWKNTFKKHDSDNSGYLDVEQLRLALEDVLNEDVTFEQSQSVLSEFAKEKHGFLDISEFVLMVTFVKNAVEESKLRASRAAVSPTEYLSDQLRQAGANMEHNRENMLNEVAAMVSPFKEILHIQDFESENKDVDLDISGLKDIDFAPAFAPSEMRCLALVSHNGMKATMKRFVLANKNILKKFRLTGTNSTMTMLREVFKDEADEIVFGPSCKSGPLGGDAELVALMCSGGLGGMLFFQDPMDAHPHQADIDCLVRQALVHNTMMANTPATALMMMTVFREALKGSGKPELIPSFFFTLESPSVAAYKVGQKKVIDSHKK